MNKREKAALRRKLSGYKFLEKEMTGREAEMTELIKTLYAPLQTRPENGTKKALEKIYAKMLGEMQTRLEDLSAARNEIEALFEGLDEYEKCICYHRFIRGVHWIDLPEFVGYEQRQCQVYETRALEKIQKKIDEKKK
jgi:hypothetical protein